MLDKQVRILAKVILAKCNEDKRHILCYSLVFAEHFIESVIKLRGDSVDLHLLSDNFILKVVNSQMKFADVHLSILRSGLRLFQTNVDLLDLLLVFLFSLPGLLLGNLKLLLILANSLELIFNNHDFGLSTLDSLLCTLELVLPHSQGASQVVVLHLVVSSYTPSASHIFIQFFNFYFVIHSFVFPFSHSLHNLVGVLGHVGQLVGGAGQLLCVDPHLLLHQNTSTSCSIHVIILVLEFLLSFFHLGGGLLQLLHGFFQRSLLLCDFL